MLIGNLPLDTKEEELSEFFQKVGNVGNVEILKDKAGRPRGFAFVTMPNPKQKEEAVSQLHNAIFKGRNISVSLAQAAAQLKPKNSLFNFFRAG